METLDKIEEAFCQEPCGKVYRSVIDRTERLLIEKALERASGNQILAAKILGLNRNTLRYKIKKLSIFPSQYRQIINR
jgi:two-component system, NtrC family, nitrogen regulation response regulator GlnG